MARVGRRRGDDRRGRATAASISSNSSYELRRHADRPVKIGSFSAASNVTGIITDVDAGRDHAAPPRRAVVLGLRGGGPVSADRHERGAAVQTGARLQGRGLRLPAQVHRRSRDARACSSSSAPLLRNRVPSVPGGGTVLFVTPTGTPTTPTRRSARRAARPGSSSRSAPGSCSRSRRRSAARRSAAASTTSPAARWRSWGANPKIEILGSTELERLAIVSLGVRHRRRPAARELRRRGAQRPVRDPGAQRLLLRRPVPPPPLRDRRDLVDAHGAPRCAAATLGAKLAFTRITFNYFISETVFHYIVDAVHLLADDGWKLLPLYRFDPATGLVAPPRRPAAADARRRGRPVPHARARPRARASPRRGSADRRGRARRPVTRGRARPRTQPGVRADSVVPPAR